MSLNELLEHLAPTKLSQFARTGSELVWSYSSTNRCGTTTYRPVHGHTRVFGVGGWELAPLPLIISSL